MFKRKAFEKLKYWKEKKAPKYSVLLEGAKRVGKSTIAEEFVKQAIRGLPVLQIQGFRRVSRFTNPLLKANYRSVP